MRRGLDRADLEQVGAIGLIKAVDRFDSRQCVPFEAYAWLLIVGELMHHVRDGERLLRAPRAVQAIERRWTEAERELSLRLGREPSENDVAGFLGATPCEAGEVRAYRASGSVLDFDLVRGEMRASALVIDQLLDRLTVERLLDDLPPLERKIVTAIHLRGSSVTEVAARLGYSRRHVTRLHRAAIERMRRSSEVGAGGSAESQVGVSVPHRR